MRPASKFSKDKVSIVLRCHRRVLPATKGVAGSVVGNGCAGFECSWRSIVLRLRGRAISQVP